MARRVFTIVLLFAPAAVPLRAADEMRARLYDVVTETRMPHLEESLRYATTREQRCLTRADLGSAFPILAHTSLSGCSLASELSQGNVVSYALACEGDSGTSGRATWTLDSGGWHGVLNVKLGGKNMTFYQRITARPIGECTRAP